MIACYISKVFMFTYTTAKCYDAKIIIILFYKPHNFFPSVPNLGKKLNPLILGNYF